MVWIVLAIFTGAISGVGFFRGTPAGIMAQALPGAAGVLFSLVMFRASSLFPDRKALGKQGGWPLMAAGALCLTSAGAAAIDVARWLATKYGTIGPYVLPVTSVGFLMLMVACLRLSLDSKRRTQFYVLAAACAANAGVAAFTFMRALNGAYGA
jgi:hypothetical protein